MSTKQRTLRRETFEILLSRARGQAGAIIKRIVHRFQTLCSRMKRGHRLANLDRAASEMENAGNEFRGIVAAAECQRLSLPV